MRISRYGLWLDNVKSEIEAEGLSFFELKNAYDLYDFFEDDYTPTDVIIYALSAL